jgi:hypothetical protein
MKSYHLRSFATGILIVCVLYSISAQSYFIAGAREAAMANSILTLGGTWSVYHNPAGIRTLNHASVGFCYENRYLLEELSTQSFAGTVPVRNGGFGVSYSYFGTSRYNEQKMALGYAHALGEKINAGILFDLYHTNLPDEYESDYIIAGEIGLIIRPIENLSIGLHLNNPTESGSQNYNTEDANTFFRSGITWHDKYFLIGTQVSIQENDEPIMSAGMEINVVPNFYVRAGISSDEKNNYTFGLGYKQKRWCGDIAFARHPILGYTSMFSIEFYPGKIKE